MYFVKKDYNGSNYDVVDTTDLSTEWVSRSTLMEAVRNGINIYGVTKTFRVTAYKNAHDIIRQCEFQHSLNGLPQPDIKLEKCGTGVKFVLRGYVGRFKNGAVRIPDFVDIIDSRCFAECADLEAVHIPASVSEIRSSAFSSCINLRVVTGCEGIETMSADCFCSCYSLTNFPNTPKLQASASYAPSYC